MRTFLYGCAASLLMAGLTQAQLQKYWARYHNGTGNSEDYGYGIAVDASGNSYVTGGATNALGVTEVVLVKYNAAGQKQWVVTYPAPGGGPDYGTKVAIDPAGNVIVGADSVGIGTDYDLTTLKYDPQGNLLWARRFNGTGNGYDGMGGGWSLTIGPAAEVFTGGFTYDAVNGYDSVILKYDVSGTLLWTGIYDGADHLNDDNYDLAVDALGNAYAAAESTSIGGRDILALKYRGTDGALLWEVGYNGPANGSELVSALDIDSSANVYLAGISPSTGGDDDFVTMKVDTNGVLQWVQRYDGSTGRDDWPWDVAVSQTGLVIAAGYSSTRYDASSATAVAYDTNGNLLWVRRFESSSFYYGSDEASDVEFDAAGNAWMAGAGWNGPEHGLDAFLVQYSPNGTQIFSDVHDGTGHADEVNFGVAIRGNDVYTGGYSQRGKRHVDTMVVRYGPPLNIMGAPGQPRPTNLGPLNLAAESEDAFLPESVEPRRYRPLSGMPGRPDRPARFPSFPK